MRILHLIAGAPFGGAETFSQDAILALAEQGVEQTVICRPHPRILERYAAAEIPALPIAFSRFERLGAIRSWVRRQAEELEADLVHAWMGRAVSFVPRRMPCPVLGWLGGYYTLRRFRRADFLMGITPHMTRHLLERGSPPHRTFLVHPFGTVPEAPPVERAALATPADAPVVLVLSRLHWKKGIDTILRAVALLPGVHLWLAGEGPERRNYERLSAKLGLGARVRFLGWRSDRRALIEAADVVALPSRHEPFGTVIAEAWAMWRPLVATRALGAVQFVADGVDGLLAPIDDPQALAQCLSRALADEALRERLCENGARKFAAGFSKEAVTARLLAAYESMLAIGKRGEDAYVAAGELDRRLAAGIADALALEFPRFLRRDLLAAVLTALAYLTLEERPCSDAADAAFALSLSGACSFLVRGFHGTRILVLDAAGLAAAERHFDINEALPAIEPVLARFHRLRLAPAGDRAAISRSSSPPPSSSW
ncbi:MAG TPA: glycosyltransferase [Stellaceae bacterium]|nr:glycosyltransferase [Stellaceae bacterium]